MPAEGPAARIRQRQVSMNKRTPIFHRDVTDEKENFHRLSPTVFDIFLFGLIVETHARPLHGADRLNPPQTDVTSLADLVVGRSR